MTPAGSHSRSCRQARTPCIVRRPGFLDLVYGQNRPGTATPGRRITLRDREEITRLVVPLSQGGSIAGAVRDDHGDPVFQATVRISRWVMRGGKRALEEVGSTQTDERGTFRAGLLPSRQYVVSAVPSEHFIGSDDVTPSQGFAAVFYPSAISVSGAETIALGVGEHRTNTDLVMPLVKLSKVTGIVLDSSGHPVPEFPVSLVDQSSGMEIEQGTMTEADGRFTFPRVAPGAHVVTAGANTGHFKGVGIAFEVHDIKGELDRVVKMFEATVLSTRHASDKFEKGNEDAAAERARGSGSAHVTVAGGVDTPDVVVRLDPPREVTGRVAFDGASRRPPTTNIEVALRSVTGFGGTAKVADDGAFTVKDVAPGRYFVEVRGPGQPWVLASATSAGVDALDSQLDVPRDRDIRELTLTFRDRSPELSGAVTDASSHPVLGRMVIVFPSDERLWAAATDRIQAVPLTEDGRFTFMDLRPGSYWLGVVADVEQDEWLQPEFLRQLRGASVTITLADGEKKTQDLRVK